MCTCVTVCTCDFVRVTVTVCACDCIHSYFVCSIIKKFLVTKGFNFTTELSRLETELTPELIQG